MNRKDAAGFLESALNVPIVDVRSPGEYSAGHIPGAVNIPLFDDEERAVVGTKYRKEGRNSAIIEGMRLAGPSMHRKLEQAVNIAAGGELLVHCWRGGMRSEAMAWLFSLGDIRTTVLEGGYKAYRNYILTRLSGKRDIIVLGGLTGSGKTHILRHLMENGRQVIDLEKLASHKGSAFGSLGEGPQPSTEQFANDLFSDWSKLDEGPVWLEDESRNIGTVFMPETFYTNMQQAPTIVLMMDIETRLPRLMEEYARFPPEALISAIQKISRRLGGDNAKDAIDAVEKGDLARAIAISLKYYDSTYMYSISRKNNPRIVRIETDTDDIAVNATRVLEAAGKIS